MTFLECWTKAASAFLPQALAGEPAFEETAAEGSDVGSTCISARLAGEFAGQFSVLLSPELVAAPLLGQTKGSKETWIEVLREIADSAAAEVSSSTGQKCWIESVEEDAVHPQEVSRAFALQAGERRWVLQVEDQVRPVSLFSTEDVGSGARHAPLASASSPGIPPGIQLLLDVELEATLRFGCRELELGEILGLGPGDVLQLDRHISDPVDLIVGDKIVAHGEVVLVGGNFGLRVTEVAAPRERLESIRCLF